MARFDVVKNEREVVCEIIIGTPKHEPMVAKTADASNEKHVPYIIEKEDGYLVKVGQNAYHPMTPEHKIEFIELIINDKMVHRYYFDDEAVAEVLFKCEKGQKVVAREYCNLHGLWEATL